MENAAIFHGTNVLIGALSCVIVSFLFGCCTGLLKIAVFFFTACFVLGMGLWHMLLIPVSYGQTRNSGYHWSPDIRCFFVSRLQNYFTRGIRYSVYTTIA